MMKYAAGPGFPYVDGRPPDPAQAIARLERWRFPLTVGANHYTTTALDQDAAEYPRCDERYATRPYRHGFYASTADDRGRAAVFDRITHYDFATNKKTL